MKNKILFLLVAVSLLSCKEKNVTETHIGVILSHGVELTVIEIDSCEYFYYGVNTDGQILTHKGNCKYCIQRVKK